MAFVAAEALKRWGDRPTTVILLRQGSGNDQYQFDNLRDAVLFAKADVTGPSAIQLQVHLDGGDTWITADELSALGEIVRGPGIETE